MIIAAVCVVATAVGVPAGLMASKSTSESVASKYPINDFVLFNKNDLLSQSFQALSTPLPPL